MKMFFERLRLAEENLGLDPNLCRIRHVSVYRYDPIRRCIVPEMYAVNAEAHPAYNLGNRLSTRRVAAEYLTGETLT